MPVFIIIQSFPHTQGLPTESVGFLGKFFTS